MHANVTSDRGGGGGGGSWRLPPDETLQVQDPKDKLDVSENCVAMLTHQNKSQEHCIAQLLDRVNEEKNTFKIIIIILKFSAGLRLWRITQLEEHCTVIARNRLCDSGHRNSDLPFRVIEMQHTNERKRNDSLIQKWNFSSLFFFCFLLVSSIRFVDM